MYAVTNHYQLTIPGDNEVRPKFEETGAFITKMPGFQGTYFAKHSDKLATLLLFWDSENAAENANKIMGPGWFATNVAPYLVGPQQRSGGEVLAQRQK